MEKQTGIYAKIGYVNKLKNPLWQRKRLEILNRDKFSCRSCGDDKIELHVHHLKYDKYGEPWNVADQFLVTLCSECHSIEENFKKYGLTKHWLSNALNNKVRRIKSSTGLVIAYLNIKNDGSVACETFNLTDKYLTFNVFNKSQFDYFIKNTNAIEL